MNWLEQSPCPLGYKLGCQSRSCWTVQLYKGLMKVYINQTNVLEGSTAVIEHKDKGQALRQAIIESFILCGYQPYKMHKKSIAIYVYNDNRVDLASWMVHRQKQDH